METSDLLLIQQLKQNEPRSFEPIFKKYFKPLVLYAKKYVKDIDAAKDITQETFMKIYEKRESLVIQTSLQSFLYSSVRNKCLDYLKLKAIRQRHQDDIKKQSPISSEAEDEEKIRVTELQIKIDEIIAKLPDQNRRIFIMSRKEGLSNQEISDVLNLSKRTVETHISNALKKIKKAAWILKALIISFLFELLT